MKRKVLFFYIIFSCYLSAHKNSNNIFNPNEEPFQEMQQIALLEPTRRNNTIVDNYEEIDCFTSFLSALTICCLECYACAHEFTKKTSGINPDDDDFKEE